MIHPTHNPSLDLPDAFAHLNLQIVVNNVLASEFDTNIYDTSYNK